MDRSPSQGYCRTNNLVVNYILRIMRTFIRPGQGVTMAPGDPAVTLPGGLCVGRRVSVCLSVGRLLGNVWEIFWKVLRGVCVLGQEPVELVRFWGWSGSNFGYRCVNQILGVIWIQLCVNQILGLMWIHLWIPMCEPDFRGWFGSKFGYCCVNHILGVICIHIWIPLCEPDYGVTWIQIWIPLCEPDFGGHLDPDLDTIV